MEQRRIYSKAPITEAIIDLRIAARAGINLEQLRRLSDEDQERFPRIDPIFETTGKLQVQPGISASASAHQNQTGFRAISSDQKVVCQRQLSGFTLSRLAPYESWEPFRDLARELWDSYRTTVGCEAVTRIAVRYVNRIDIPESPVELKQYFRTSPEVSPDLPQMMEGFFMQIRLPQSDIASTAVLNQTIVASDKAGCTPVVLDIDLFRDHALPNDECELWDFFEVLHNRKNEIFEACITDAARELFD
ncbi:MAG: TIGR04255 family protein [Planctomycetaceae bacterium]